MTAIRPPPFTQTLKSRSATFQNAQLVVHRNPERLEYSCGRMSWTPLRNDRFDGLHEIVRGLNR